ncbi:FilE [Acinetobacter gyllenbergii CIP 110306 = MTCC 11365]|nr:FilE [Acinetobacter gyllenbergii CIP 110306 = MTCC 11365]
MSSTGFSQVDGVDYVNNEYLENQEFNLDGKKRFYTMPDGTGRMETIERKKGVSRSILDKLLNRSQQATAPIALSGTYVRLSSEDLKSAFEDDRCFVEGYKKSIKTLTLKKDVGLWPRKPLKEKFEYEVVKLDPAIEYMQIDSYASNNEKPVYYWPLVVFLNEKGCIEEGVSGFKNSQVAATMLQHSALQGVIKVPKDAHYIMMTPLASAVDVSEQELSNQGQIKISVLQ